jgi:hypothetical protein
VEYEARRELLLVLARSDAWRERVADEMEAEWRSSDGLDSGVDRVRVGFGSGVEVECREGRVICSGWI